MNRRQQKAFKHVLGSTFVKTENLRVLKIRNLVALSLLATGILCEYTHGTKQHWKILLVSKKVQIHTKYKMLGFHSIPQKIHILSIEKPGSSKLKENYLNKEKL